MLIEQEALKNWTQGSYEWIRADVARCLRESNLILETGLSWKLLATFSESCIIVNQSGEFVKAELGINEDQSRYVKSLGKIDSHPKVYQEEEQYFADKTKACVKLFSEGKSDPDLTDMIYEKINNFDINSAICNLLEAQLETPSGWDNHYHENEIEINRSLWRINSEAYWNVRCSESNDVKYIELFLKHLGERSNQIKETCNNNTIHDICESIRSDSSTLGFWVSKIEERENPSYRATLGNLIQCVHKMDKVVSYYESLKGT